MNWEGYAWIAWLAAFFILETIGLWKRPDGGMTKEELPRRIQPDSVFSHHSRRLNDERCIVHPFPD